MPIVAYMPNIAHTIFVIFYIFFGFFAVGALSHSNPSLLSENLVVNSTIGLAITFGLHSVFCMLLALSEQMYRQLDRKTETKRYGKINVPSGGTQGKPTEQEAAATLKHLGTDR